MQIYTVAEAGQTIDLAIWNEAFRSQTEAKHAVRNAIEEIFDEDPKLEWTVSGEGRIETSFEGQKYEICRVAI